MVWCSSAPLRTMLSAALGLAAVACSPGASARTDRDDDAAVHDCSRVDSRVVVNLSDSSSADAAGAVDARPQRTDRERPEDSSTGARDASTDAGTPALQDARSFAADATCESRLLTTDAAFGFGEVVNLPCADFSATGETCVATRIRYRLLVRASEDVSVYFAPPVGRRVAGVGQSGGMTVLGYGNHGSDMIGGYTLDAVQCMNIRASNIDRIMEVSHEANYKIAFDEPDCVPFEYGARRTDLTFDVDGVCDELTQVVPGSRHWSTKILYREWQ